MQQVAYGFCGDEIRNRYLPEPGSELLPGVLWGSFEHLFTPAFWVVHAWQCSLSGQLPHRHTLGSSLQEEVAACLLGGYGIPAEIGLAAYDRLRARGLLAGRATESALLHALSEPLCVGGRSVRYRFARQKAVYLAAALQALDQEKPATELTDVQMRNWLTRLPGIGLKTASWITRNIRGSDEVAIIDVHVFRAGRLAGLFPASATIERDYETLERLFVAFAAAISVRASQLDALVWDFMKRVGPVAIDALRERDTNPEPKDFTQRETSACADGRRH